MEFGRLLEQYKSVIVKAWFELVISTYAPDTAQFYKSQQDDFANPVGSIVRRALTALYDRLPHPIDPSQTKQILDPMVRIRAVQNFTPSQAIGFIFALKQLVRSHVRSKLDTDQTEAAMRHLDAKIDEIGLLAFDVYMECREKLYDLKANETKNRTLRAFERAGLILESSMDGPDSNIY